MNCDQAFDSLTDYILRGSSELQAHLSACPRCREMAEILEPALGLFEQVDEFENRSGWQPELDSAHEDDAVQLRPRQRLQSAPWLNAQRQQQRRSARRDGAKVAVLLLFVAAVTVAFANVGREERKAELLASIEPCLRTSTNEESTAGTLVAQCVSCHVELVQLAKLEHRQQAEADRMVTRCVTCHLSPVREQPLDPMPELLQACLFPIPKT